MKHLLLLATLLPTLAAAQTPPVDQTTNMVMTPAAIAEARRQVAVGGTGRFKAEMRSEPSLPTHTIYAPRDLKAAGKLPVIVWGNGACANAGNRFQFFLTEIASHGYAIVAVGPVGPDWLATNQSRTPPGSPPPPPAPPGSRKQETKAPQLIDGLEWALKENARPGSRYYGRLDPSRLAVMGQSCGGLQAIWAASNDTRFKTLIVWNSGTFPDGAPPLDGADATKENLKRLHLPVAWISGDERDVAFKNSNADFDRVEGIRAMRLWGAGIGHGGTYREPGGGRFAQIGAAWLDWQLKGDAKAGRMFSGPDCILCKDKAFTLKWKGVK
ncbi:hypothetical protein [Sphingomonas sp. SUN039]|uniref:hypothetical protein n=1 Tax=Sphingomonas sp. SUN039 TaxID=2937787 RepID=UPI002164352B|nr:hypothetical protein [Sphingomonas sp. SUN039]UVO54379.1 hypothetical protein M0209_09695 [Sphingomonas sp. SUN039]